MIRSSPRSNTFTALLVLILLSACPLAATAQAAPYHTGWKRWHAARGEFTGWQLDGVRLDAANRLRLDPAHAHPGHDVYAAGTYEDHSFYNGAAFLAGEATSPVTSAGSGFREAIVSWNANTPAGTWIETRLRARVGTRWTGWYNLGVWASGTTTVERHSVADQDDDDAQVLVDTLVLRAIREPASAYQVKLRLFTTRRDRLPSVYHVAVAFSSSTPEPSVQRAPGNPALWGQVLAVPECSQMVYADGGEVWCSPTSTAMVLGYWDFVQHGSVGASCPTRVFAARDGVFDWLYDGHGNWPFNTAFAATQGLDAFVVRFAGLAEAEPWIAAGVPVVVSFAWGRGELEGSALPSSDGHLAVLVGFDSSGNPVINDPAAAEDEMVQRVYMRDEFEPLWLEDTGGTAYLIFPRGWEVPAR